MWIEPLALKTWLVNVMAGSSTYFAPIAIFAILVMAATFRMTGLTIGFMLFIFLLMFSDILPPSIFTFAAIIGGLLVGWQISRIVK